jgi:hypothetical protein
MSRLTPDFQVQQRRWAFRRHAQRSAFHCPGARQQSRLFALLNQWLRPSPNSNRPRCHRRPNSSASNFLTAPLGQISARTTRRITESHGLATHGRSRTVPMGDRPDFLRAQPCSARRRKLDYFASALTRIMSPEDPIQRLRHHLLDRCAMSICDDSQLLHGLSIERIYWE